jgi:hypothetical protein
MDEEVKEVLAFEKLVCEFINKGNYLSAFLMLQNKLRDKAKKYPVIEDKRTETLN